MALGGLGTLLSAVVLVFIFINRDANQPTEMKSVSPTQSPTALPTSRATVRYQYVRAAVLELFGSNAVVMIDTEEDSPQARAVRWLSENDALLFEGESEAENPLLRSVTSGIRFKQRYALTVFAYSTGVYQWKVSTGWLDPAVDECDWFSVVCNDRDRVYNIHMGSNFLTGLLPTELAGLSFLWQLIITDNGGVTGTIPTELASIEPLERLRLRNLSLGGSIPDEFNAKFNLAFLYLNGNMLTGTIPTRLGELPNLSYLYLYENRMEGTIPGKFVGIHELA